MLQLDSLSDNSIYNPAIFSFQRYLKRYRNDYHIGKQAALPKCWLAADSMGQS